MKSKHELHIFDFDSTLFRSPPPPATWTGGEFSWYDSEESLLPPYVNDSNVASFWIADVLSEALTSCSNQDVLCVLMTGRSAGNAKLSNRILELIDSVGLRFNDVFLRSPRTPTKHFKFEKIRELLKKNPDIQRIVFWDDRDDLMKFYEENIHKEFDGIEIITHHIT